MVYFEIVDESYNKPTDIYNVLNYIFNPCKVLSGHIGALNTNLIDVKTMVNEFKIAKHVFGKESGRQLRHFIVSFDINTDPEKALNIAYQLALYYAKEYQIVFAVHSEKAHIHIHFVMNSVSFIDGSMYRKGFEDWYSFIEFGKKVVKNFLEVSKAIAM